MIIHNNIVFSPFDSKTLIKDENERRLLAFYLSDDTKHEMIPHSNVPGRLFTGHLLAYDREIINVGQHAVHIIKQEGEVSHFIWRTSPAAFTQGIDDGIVPLDMLDALTAKVRQAIGGYMKSTRNRLYKSGIISDKSKEKYALLRLTQSRVKMLEPLERLINNANPTLSDKENHAIISAILKDYIETLKTYQQQLDSKFVTLSYYDKDAVQTIFDYIQHDINNATTLMDGLEEISAKQLYRPSGRKSLGSFIKKEMIRYLREAQALNQNLCYSRRSGSFFRGDFNSSCEDALRQINIHRPDTHNPVLKEHQGNFYSTHKELAINFQTLGQDGREIESTLMGIAQIEGSDKLTEKNDTLFMHKLDDTHYAIKQTNKTKWVINEARGYTILRVGAWCWNVTTGICLGLTIDLFAGLALGLLGYRPPSLASMVQFHLPVEVTHHTKYHNLIDAMKPPTYSLGTLVGFKLGNFVKNVAWDLINGATTTIKQFKFELWENLSADFKLGHHPKVIEQQVIQSFNDELSHLKDKQQEIFDYINSKSERFKSQKPHTLKAISPVPPYRLSDGEWLDIINESVHGARFVAETFTHNIHSKHPVAGIIFSLSYLSGVFVILMPELLTFLPKGYLAFSHTLANAMSKGGLTKAVGSGMTQAQLFTAGFNALIEGNDSWIAQGGREFEKNPSNILVYISLAVGLGALIAFELDIPYISETLREDLGNIPIPSLGFAGAKMGILLIDLIREKKPEAIKEHIPEIRQQLDDIIKQFTHIEEEDKRSSVIDMLLSDEFLLKFQEKSTRIKQDISNPQKNELKKLAFLYRLENEKELLPKLSTQTKRELIELAKQYFPGHKETIKTITQLLYPPPPQSIFIITLTTVIYYLPLLIRCFGSAVTFSPAPFIDLKDKIQKDLTRLAVASANAVHGLTSFIKVTFRGVFDLIGNEIVARSASLIGDNVHPVTSFNYTQSTNVDVGYETLSQTFSDPVESWKKEATYTSPAHMITQEGLFFFKKSAAPPSNIISAQDTIESDIVTPSSLLSPLVIT